jgi:hypothetical protein
LYNYDFISHTDGLTANLFNTISYVWQTTLFFIWKINSKTFYILYHINHFLTIFFIFYITSITFNIFFFTFYIMSITFNCFFHLFIQEFQNLSLLYIISITFYYYYYSYNNFKTSLYFISLKLLFLYYYYYYLKSNPSLWPACWARIGFRCWWAWPKRKLVS